MPTIMAIIVVTGITLFSGLVFFTLFSKLSLNKVGHNRRLDENDFDSIRNALLREVVLSEYPLARLPGGQKISFQELRKNLNSNGTPRRKIITTLQEAGINVTPKKRKPWLGARR